MPERYFFVHVQKTGGTDLFARLGGDPTVPLDYEPSLPIEAIYPNPTDGDVFTVAPQLSVDQLLARWAVRQDEIRIVLGHFPLCTVDLLDVPFTTLTVLREPVERTLSFLRHHRRLTPADRDAPLEAIYEDDFRYHALIHNHMVKMFALTAPEMTDGMLTRVDFTPEHLERAQARLATVDVIGFQEEFDRFADELARRYGWELGKNLNANWTAPVDVPDSFRRRIAEDNALDVELYEYARANLDVLSGR
jgi:hypothetical protein